MDGTEAIVGREALMAIIGEYEPAGTRESAVITALRDAFSPAGSFVIRLNSNQYTGSSHDDDRDPKQPNAFKEIQDRMHGPPSTLPQPLGGMRLADRFVTRLEVKDAMKRALTYRQFAVLWYRFGLDWTQKVTAIHMHLDRETVRIDEVAGLQAMVRVLWNDAAYVSPPRWRKEPSRHWLTEMARP